MKTEIPLHERLIVDISDLDCVDSVRVIESIGNRVAYYRVGTAQISSGDAVYLTKVALANASGVFWDGRIFDTPVQTIKALVQLLEAGVAMVSVSGLGGQAMLLDAACAAHDYKALKISPLIVASLFPENISFKDLENMGLMHEYWTEALCRIKFLEINAQIAKLAKDSGLDGVVTTQDQVAYIREACAHSFRIAVPCVIRNMEENAVAERIEKIMETADQIFVGSPITSSPGIKMAEVANKILDAIGTAHLQLAVKENEKSKGIQAQMST